ncbi:MAG: YjcZ family sporulation protein [Firmicutes bacterium]|nr:YjcZ family sporulation protein [Bacillota bacterium]
MSCVQNSCEGNHNNGFVIIIVLYVLLAIILGSAFFY